MKRDKLKNSKFSNLKYSKHPLSDFVQAALIERGLMNAYRERPAYQQNDYLGWIAKAKREETKLKRLAQMLDELEAGGVYMKMQHPASVATGKSGAGG